MTKSIAVKGEGRLADLLCKELSISHQVIRPLDWQIPDSTELVLVVSDAWQPAFFQTAEQQLKLRDFPWMRAFLSFGEAIIGPLVQPDVSGCSRCADRRRIMAGFDRQEMVLLQKQLAQQSDVPADAWTSHTGLHYVTQLLVAKVQNILHTDDPELAEQIYLINLKTLKSTRHPLLPDPQCSSCSKLPDDSLESAQITLQPSPKLNSDSYRCRSLDELKQVLASDYLDPRTGLLNGQMNDTLSPFAAVSVNLPLFVGDEATAGRTLNYADSQLTAILEGLERSCGLAPRGKRTVIHDCYRNLADIALHPLQVGVHTKEQYDLPNFPFQAFDPDRSINWVWGYSLIQERSILVPELLSYYSLGCGNGFVYETSNGCAIGGSLEEAIFYGMLEVVERDAFLLTWYAQLQLPRLDINSANDQELQWMIDRIQTVGGYEIHLFNATMENQIPSVWAIAKNTKQTGLHLICAAGAHLDPLRAAKSALHELAGMMLVLDEKFEQNKEKYLQMFEHSSLVQEMENHSMLYGLPQSADRLQFLLAERAPLQAFDQAFPTWPKHTDLTDDLQQLLLTFKQLHLDVIVIQQTTSELKRNGLHCVKVLIPGMLPMTFGQQFTRLVGLNRVLEVPMKLGYTEHPLTLHQLNPHPHPFP